MCWLLHSCGRGDSKRILRTAYYRHGACVISRHVLGRIRECSCHRGTNRQTRKGDDTKSRMDEQRQASAVFPPQRRWCLSGRITANNGYSARSRCRGRCAFRSWSILKSVFQRRRTSKRDDTRWQDGESLVVRHQSTKSNPLKTDN